MVTRYLITTADESTWKFDRPVLFLGEWCRLYDRKHIWKEMDAIVAGPYRLEPKQQQEDIAYIYKLYMQLLNELTVGLNEYHNTHHKQRYWNILLGHWLQRYIFTIHDRYYTLLQTLEDYRVERTFVLNIPNFSLATHDSSSAKWVWNNEIWNHVLCSRILAFLGGVEFDKDIHAFEDVLGFQREHKSTLGRLHVLKKILSKIKRQDDAFIINSYLPQWEEVKLQLALGQFPQKWSSPPLTASSFDKDIRKRFIVSSDGYVGFERFLRLQLSEMIPICYLEGYNQLCQQIKTLPWPISPKFIFTSNNFDTDDIFKAWAGEKIEQGCPYFIGQHGANYGTFYPSINFPELVTCDKFFTWGWTHNIKKNISAYNFRITNQKQKTSKNGGLLLIELPFLDRIGLADLKMPYADFQKYQEDQFSFVDALPEYIQKNITVRLHREWQIQSWSDKQRWNDRMPTIKIEIGLERIKVLIAKSRLVVYSYDSTGMLENLALNVPTICFWYYGLNHLSQEAKPYYELLRNAGILADTPERAAEIIALHWDNIDEWWNSALVQDARSLFCGEYSRTVKYPIKHLTQLLLKQI